MKGTRRSRHQALPRASRAAWMRWPASSAMGARAGLSGTSAMILGSRASTTVRPSSVRTTTLHGSNVAMRGSISRARWASWGLQAEDDLVVDVDVELVLESLADVDLGEDPEALFLERISHTGDSVLVGGVELDAAGEVHGSSSPVLVVSRWRTGRGRRCRGRRRRAGRRSRVASIRARGGRRPACRHRLRRWPRR